MKTIGLPLLRFPFPGIAIAVAVLAPLACAPRGAVRPGLRPDEAVAIAAQVHMNVAAALPGAATSAQLVSNSPASAGWVTTSIDRTVPCPRGGLTQMSGQVTGQFDALTQAMYANVASRQVPFGCAHTIQGVSVYTTGAPDLITMAHVVAVDGMSAGIHTVTAKGGFTWTASDGRSGSCTVDYSSKADYTAKTFSVIGSFCGTALRYHGRLAS